MANDKTYNGGCKAAEAIIHADKPIKLMELNPAKVPTKTATLKMKITGLDIVLISFII